MVVFFIITLCIFTWHYIIQEKSLVQVGRMQEKKFYFNCFSEKKRINSDIEFFSKSKRNPSLELY